MGHQQTIDAADLPENDDILDTQGEEIDAEDQLDAEQQTPHDLPVVPDPDIHGEKARQATHARMQKKRPSSDGQPIRWNNVQIPVGDGTTTPMIPIAYATKRLAMSVHGAGRYRYMYLDVDLETGAMKNIGYSKQFQVIPRPPTNTESLGGAVTPPACGHPTFTDPMAVVEKMPDLAALAGTAAPQSPPPTTGPFADLATAIPMLLQLLRGLAFLVHEASTPQLLMMRQQYEAASARQRDMAAQDLANTRSWANAQLERDREWVKMLSAIQRQDNTRIRELENEMGQLSEAANVVDPAQLPPPEPATNMYDTLNTVIDNAPSLIDKIATLAAGKVQTELQTATNADLAPSLDDSPPD